MQSLIIKNVVSRTKVVDLKSVLERWGWLEQEVEQVDIKLTKREIANNLIDICSQKDGISKDVYGELDLICTQEYSTRKQWSVYLMEKNDEHFISSRNLSNPQNLRRKLRNEITLFFDRENSVSVRMLNGVLWIRVFIQSGPANTYRTSDTVYIIYYPRTQYILISKFKKSVQEYLFQSLQNVMGCDKLTALLLTGSHYESLIQLALEKKSQGGFSKFRHQQVQNLPLLQRKPQKRKAPLFERDPNVTCEDENFKRQRYDDLEECFGPNEQPKLQKLEFKVAVKFRGTTPLPEAEDPNRPFHCRVKFEGSSVIDGIRNLAECGLVDLPLPKYLATVHTLGKNHIKLADKTAQIQNQEQSTNVQKENSPSGNTRSKSRRSSKAQS